MTDPTPTTEEVREQFAANINRFGDGFGTREVGREGFDRWLADFKRKIAAEALRDAAREMRGDGKRVLIDAEESADWLDNYADGFEQGGES